MTPLKKKLHFNWPPSLFVVTGGLALILLVFVFLRSGSFFSSPQTDLKHQTFSTLKKIRITKKKDIIAYFSNLKKTAQSIRTDKQMLQAFSALQKNTRNLQLEHETDIRYVEAYSNFYDILFVDSTGYVFHSIRKERDYQTNILLSDRQESPLAAALKNNDKKQFLEFNYYLPSHEAAAFFIISVQEKGRQCGWFILQFASNSVNEIMTDYHDMGRTGEVYLVNQENLMLSDSRFMEDSSILKQKVDTTAVKEALANQAGEDIIFDYRGEKVFSSFERLEVLGTTWIIIAEIDEAEVITEHYRKHKKYFLDIFARSLAATRTPVPNNHNKVFFKTKQIDMNEFAKANNGEVLVTKGVSKCTAVAITYPGKFSYLSHIAPTDRIYLDNPLAKHILKKRYHDFLGGILTKIEFYDIYPYEIVNLHIVIVATHTDSIAKAIDIILDRGLDLKNITFSYNPKAYSANVWVDEKGNNVTIQWNEDGKIYEENARSFEPLDMLVKKSIHYPI